MSTSERILHIVEPTLQTEQGHCMGLVRSLCEASPAFRHTVWAGQRLTGEALGASSIDVRRYFHRRLRKVQLFFLYRKLLAQPGAIVATTAGRIDLLALTWAASGPIAPGKVFLYFHWLRLTPRKRAFFQRFARNQPNVVALATTPSVQHLLQECGFRHAVTMPYPVTSADAENPSQASFRHLLFAGAARADKGFGLVVDLIEFLARQGESIPFLVQTSPDHYDKYDAPTRADLDRLTRLHYPHLTTRSQAMTSEEYAGMFRGAICLQPYSRQDFADRVSGVTLDAFAAGAPVVTLSGTWIARMVQRFKAGEVIEDATVEALHEAVRLMFDDYASYQTRARAAGIALREEGRWKELLQLLDDGGAEAVKSAS